MFLGHEVLQALRHDGSAGGRCTCLNSPALSAARRAALSHCSATRRGRTASAIAISAIRATARVTAPSSRHFFGRTCPLAVTRPLTSRPHCRSWRRLPTRPASRSTKRTAHLPAAALRRAGAGGGGASTRDGASDRLGAPEAERLGARRRGHARGRLRAPAGHRDLSQRARHQARPSVRRAFSAHCRRGLVYDVLRGLLRLHVSEATRLQLGHVVARQRCGVGNGGPNFATTS